jgi:uncharacterized membrane protein
MAMQLEHTSLSVFSGPLPSANELAKYEMILPGFANRLLTRHERQLVLTEEQVRHRFGLENKSLFMANIRSYLGMILAGAIPFCTACVLPIILQCPARRLPDPWRFLPI